MSSDKLLACKVGSIDAVIFFVVWSGVGLVSVTHPISSLPIIVLLLAPVSAFVGWRGGASVRLILAGVASLRRAVGEGFIWGTAFLAVIVAWFFFSEAHAAGTAIDGLSPWQLEFWVRAATVLVPAMGIGGVIGALHGVVYLYLRKV